MLNIKEFLGLGYYTSELDQFLAEYEKTHPQLSASQQREVEKYKRIYQLRDNQQQQPVQTTSFWDKF